MIDIYDKANCSGCHACMSVCPKKAIQMKEDTEGFLYPEIKNELCVNCGLCEKSCQAIQPIKVKREPLAYACNHKEDGIRAQSSSGGVFSAVASWIIQQGGVVFGAGFDEELNVCHISVEKEDDMHLLRGSKYVQSTIGNSFVEAKKYLDQGRLVLFSGTPCQIDGLLHYLCKDYDNLYTQDIICHGVPSPKVWRKYISFMERTFGGKIKCEPHPSFRMKGEGWMRYAMSLTFDNDMAYHVVHREDIYMRAFLKNCSLRLSCYQCHSKTTNRNSDITLADLWGAKSICPELFDDKGTSFVWCNSEKGYKMLMALADQLEIQEISLSDGLKYNTAAYESEKKPSSRQWFFNNLDQYEFDYVVKKATKPTLSSTIKKKVISLAVEIKHFVFKK